MPTPKKKIVASKSIKPAVKAAAKKPQLNTKKIVVKATAKKKPAKSAQGGESLARTIISKLMNEKSGQPKEIPLKKVVPVAAKKAAVSKVLSKSTDRKPIKFIKVYR